MNVALDANILAYAEGTNGVEMREKAKDRGALGAPHVTWRGVTVTNSFASLRHPLLETLLTNSVRGPGKSRPAR